MYFLQYFVFSPARVLAVQKAVLQADRSNINIPQAGALILLRQGPVVQTVLGAYGISRAPWPSVGTEKQKSAEAESADKKLA